MKDFVGQQQRARLKTERLFPWFFLAVLLTAVALFLVCTIIYVVGKPIIGWFISLAAAVAQEEREVEFAERLWMPQLFQGVLGLVVLIVMSGSLYKIIRLRKGGSFIARSLGARPLDPGTEALEERRLLNVVEEMSIASSVPMPEVYVLEHETGINAFAAGHSPTDAAVGVTRGCLQHLTRDELQGVIAHEFSHILNGDMRINVRLMGLVHGIFCLALLAEYVMSLGESREERTLFGIILDLFRGAMAFLLAFIGFNGAYFGKVIKSAVSRQREFLADAAAVQFTRYPDGLAGALKKAEALARHRFSLTPAVEEASHIFFNNVFFDESSTWTSTHPPVAERVRRLDPLFNQSVAPPDFDKMVQPEPSAPPAQPAQPKRAAGKLLEQIPLEAILTETNIPSYLHLDYAVGVMEAVPNSIRESSRKPFSACALVYALLLSSDAATRQEQLKQIQAQVPAEVYNKLVELLPKTATLDPRAKIPLVATTFPALRRLTGPQYDKFSQTVQMLVQFDQQVDIFEFSLQKMLIRHLEPHFKEITIPFLQYKSLRPLAPASEVLLSILAHVGQETPEQTEKAFRIGGQTLGLPADWLNLIPLEKCGFAELEWALEQFAQAADGIKNQVLNACVQTVAADGVVQVKEAELLRAIADALGCPIPPFVSGANE